jgi:hypothetical protein
MSTFAQMEARIISELHRDDIASVVDDYINDAIAHYQRFRFWFNEKKSMTVTVAGTDLYNWPTDLVKLDRLVMLVNSRETGLELVAPEDIDGLGIQASDRGEPEWYANYGKAFRLYPCPDKAYPLAQYYLFTVPPQNTGDAVENMWTANAEELIRTRAKKLLVGQFMPTSQDTMGWASMLDKQEHDLFQDMQRQTQESTQSGRLRSWDA